MGGQLVGAGFYKHLQFWGEKYVNVNLKTPKNI